MLCYVKGHFGCLSCHLCAVTTTLTLESTHTPWSILQLQAHVHTGLGWQRRCKFEHTRDEVASITEKELFANS